MKRTETDAMGPVEIDQNALWGAQTQRAVQHFEIGSETMPEELIRALCLIKQAAANTNASLNIIDKNALKLITHACQTLIQDFPKNAFPLALWISGSGTQCNMNVNEVLANIANQHAGSRLGSKHPIHPNDHVNKSQSTNDAFPTAMHIATAQLAHSKLLPSLDALQHAFDQKAKAFDTIIKIGRTHMQDAVPMTLGQEFSAFSRQLENAKARIQHALEAVYAVTIGGTAVGTGLNTPKGYTERMISELKHITKLPLRACENRFEAQGSHDALAHFMGTLKQLANACYKIASDIRLLSCGPRAGLQELNLPENEPGSSIMPGKVNPTQCEAMTMVALQVIGFELAVSMANNQGHLQMNAYKPLIIYNILQSMHLLADSMARFRTYCLEGIEPNHASINTHLERSLMRVTALVPIIGYDRAAELAHYANKHSLSLQEANRALGCMEENALLAALDPKTMLSGG